MSKHPQASIQKIGNNLVKTPVSKQKPSPAINAVSTHRLVSTKKPVSANVEDFLSQVVEKYGNKNTVVLPPHNSNYNNAVQYNFNKINITDETNKTKFKEEILGMSSGKRVTKPVFNLLYFININNVGCILINIGCIVNNVGCIVNNVG